MSSCDKISVHVIECAGPPTIIPTEVGQHWVDTASKRHYLSVGTSAITDWICVDASDVILSGTITASTSLDLDIIALTSLCTVKYIVCIHNTVEDKWKSFEILAGKKTATTVEDSLYSTIGSILDVDFDFSVVGTDAKLIGTNNEIFDVDYRIHKNLV